LARGANRQKKEKQGPKKKAFVCGPLIGAGGGTNAATHLRWILTVQGSKRKAKSLLL